MKSITVSLLTDPTDRSVFYRASDEELGAAADSDHVPGLRDRDFHAASALAAQAVARLGERLQAGEQSGVDPLRLAFPMARNIYRLSAEGHLWTLQVGGHVLGRWRSRDGALRRAQAIAAGDQPSLLVVHAPDGSIEIEHPFGHDPHPSGG